MELFVHNFVVVIIKYHEEMGIKVIIIGVMRAFGNFNFCRCFLFLLILFLLTPQIYICVFYQIFFNSLTE